MADGPGTTEMTTTEMADGRDMGRDVPSALVIIDMTVEQVQTVSFRKAETIDAIRVLLERRCFDVVIDARLWIHNAKETTLWTLFPGEGRADAPGSALIPELEAGWAALSDPKFFEPKLNYSAFYATRLDARLRECGIRRLYLVGINTDYCVFATALDAFYRGYEVKIVSDAVTTFSGERGHEIGLDLATRHFGKAAIVSSKDVLATGMTRHKPGSS